MQPERLRRRAASRRPRHGPPRKARAMCQAIRRIRVGLATAPNRVISDDFVGLSIERVVLVGIRFIGHGSLPWQSFATVFK